MADDPELAQWRAQRMAQMQAGAGSGGATQQQMEERRKKEECVAMPRCFEMHCKGLIPRQLCEANTNILNHSVRDVLRFCL